MYSRNGRICGIAMPNPTITAASVIASRVTRVRSGSVEASPNVRYSANSAVAIKR